MSNPRAVHSFFSLLLLSLLVFSTLSYPGMSWGSPARFPSRPLGGPLPASPLVYVLLADGSIYGADFSSGAVQSLYSLGLGASAGPVLSGDAQVALFGSDDGRLTALRNGRKLWDYSPNFACPPRSRGCIPNSSLRSLAASGSMFYAAYNDRLIALNSSGYALWEVPLSSSNASLVAADSAHAYVLDGEDLVAYKTSREFAWRMHLGPSFQSGISSDGQNSLVFAASTNGYVVAIDAMSGTIKWSYPVSGWAMDAPASNGAVAAFSDNSGMARGIDAKTGEPLWSASIGAPSWGTPLILSRKGQSIAVFPTRAGELVALDLADGSMLWSYPLSERATGAAVGNDGRTILVFTSDSQLWAVSAWPMCTIDYPKTGQYVTSSFELSGRAWSWPGVKNVKISLDGTPYPILSMNGSGTFIFPLELGQRSDGEVQVSCIAEDLDGLVENDAVRFKSIPVLSPLARKSNLTITVVPTSPRPGLPFSVYVRDGNQFDVANLLIEFDGRNVSANSPATLTAPSREGSYALIVRKTGFESALSSVPVRNADSPLLLILLLAFALLAGAAFFMLSQKKKPKPPADYSRV